MNNKEIIEKIAALQREKNWTRFVINNYTTNDFLELDSILNEIYKSEDIDEIKRECKDMLGENQSGGVGLLYLVGILEFEEQDSYILNLLDTFAKKYKWNIIKYICERTLKIQENKNVLRFLAKCYESENASPKELFSIYKKIVDLDQTDTKYTTKIAEKFEDEGKLDEAIFYYRRVMFAFLEKKEFSKFKDMWDKLLEIDKNTEELQSLVLGKALSILDLTSDTEKEKMLMIYELAYLNSLKKNNFDLAIEIAKKTIELDSKNKNYRENLIDAYKNRYKNHSRLDYAIKKSNLDQGLRDIFQAIKIFEEIISFDVDTYVHHNSWGVGLVKNINENGLLIYFEKKKEHTMTFDMALSSLTPLAKDHIWVYKKVIPKDKLVNKVKKDIKWVLKTIVNSFKNETDTKKIKEELVPDLLKPSEWTSWSQKARRILKTDSNFSVLSENSNVYVIREHSISIDRKYIEQFSAEKNFYEKVKIFKEFIKYIKEEEPKKIESSDFAKEFIAYFLGYANQLGEYQEYTENSFISLLLLSSLTEDFPGLKIKTNVSLQDFFKQNGESLFDLFNLRDDNDYKKIFLKEIYKHYPNWDLFYLKSLLLVQNKDTVLTLVKEGKTEELLKLFVDSINAYNTRKEFFIWFYKNFKDEPWFIEEKIESKKIIPRLFSLLDETYIAIENKRAVSANKKIHDQVYGILFKNQEVYKYIEECSPEEKEKLYILVSEIKSLNSEDREMIIKAINSSGGELKIIKKKVDSTLEKEQGFFTCAKSYIKMQQELNQIINVELPQNSKEIEKAREYGDLKENAEYKAAKERQKILQKKIVKIQNDLGQAKVLSIKDVSTKKIFFGSEVELFNFNTNETEKYQIMGPWESDAEKKIVSYQAPFGEAIYGKKLNEEIEFEINDIKYHYRVDKIEVSDFLK